MSALDRFDGLSNDDALAALLRCCGSTRWAHGVAARRPFHSVDALHGAAGEIWRACGRDDFLEALAAHPRIGGAGKTSAWSAGEQSGVHEAGPAVRARLAAANDEYFERFGYIFLIRASGRTTAEMLEQLELRLKNDPDDELQVAAEQQWQITALRLDKLLAELESA